MKRQILKQFIFTLIGMLFLNVANAQWGTTSQTTAGNEVYVGSTFNYRVPVVGTNTYVWSLDGGGTLKDNGTSGGFDEASVLWTTAGTYTVTVIETTAPEGCSTTNTFQVKVIGNDSEINIPADIANCGGETGTTNFTSDLTFTKGTAPWTIVYNIGAGDVTKILTGAGTSETFAKDFTNTPGGIAQVYTITIKDAYDKYGVRPSNHDFDTDDDGAPDNDVVITYTMNEVPATSAIQHD